MQSVAPDLAVLLPTMLAAAALTLLLIAALSDLATRTIPNSICVALAAIGLFARMALGPTELLSSLGATAILFALLFFAWSRGMLGGGDVKIMSAVALGLAPLDCLSFLEGTALTGGAIALFYLLVGKLLPKTGPAHSRLLLPRLAMIEAWRMRRRVSMPYGLAIAAGGAITLINSLPA